MRLSELVGVHVVTSDGKRLGRVHDVLLVQDGPVGPNLTAGLRLHALAVGRRSFGTQLGYTQGTVKGPWLFHKVFARPPRIVPWQAIVERRNGEIVVDPERMADGAPADEH
ncbi:MAG: PRC-barrel domain-containing protein [Acidimicrobiia bacterium]